MGSTPSESHNCVKKDTKHEGVAEGRALAARVMVRTGILSGGERGGRE
jgi:hypothetical protein